VFLFNDWQSSSAWVDLTGKCALGRDEHGVDLHIADCNERLNFVLVSFDQRPARGEGASCSVRNLIEMCFRKQDAKSILKARKSAR